AADRVHAARRLRGRIRSGRRRRKPAGVSRVDRLNHVHSPAMLASGRRRFEAGMSELRKEAYGPVGDVARHIPFDELAVRLAALAPPPRDAGVLALVVRRLADGTRETPARVRLTPDEGVPGDGWNRRPPRAIDAQLAVMRRDVAAM